MPRHIVRTNPSTGIRRYVPRTNPSVMISADQLRPGDVIDMEDLGREHVIQGPYRDGRGVRFLDLYGNSILLRPKEAVRLVMRENPRRTTPRTTPRAAKRKHSTRRNPIYSPPSRVVALQQDVASILDRANALPPTVRFRETSQGGLEVKSVWVANRVLKDKTLFNRLSAAAAGYGFDNVPTGSGIIMLPFGKRVYTHRHVEAYENPRGRRKTKRRTAKRR